MIDFIVIQEILNNLLTVSGQKERAEFQQKLDEFL
jgi:hypothetical protein